MSNIGELRTLLKLKEMRLKHNLTMKELASILNVTTKTIYHYESGKRGVKLDVIIKLAELYECNISDLV